MKIIVGNMRAMFLFIQIAFLTLIFSSCLKENERIVFFNDVLPQISEEIVGVRNYPIPPMPKDSLDTVVDLKVESSLQVTIDTCVMFCEKFLNLSQTVRKYNDYISIIPKEERTREIKDLIRGFHEKSRIYTEAYSLPVSESYHTGCHSDMPCVIVQVSDVHFDSNLELAVFMASASCGEQCSWGSLYLAKKANDKWTIVKDYLRYIE